MRIFPGSNAPVMLRPHASCTSNKRILSDCRLHSNTLLIQLGSHMGGCQNYDPFLGPIIIRHLIFRGPKRGP